MDEKRGEHNSISTKFMSQTTNFHQIHPLFSTFVTLFIIILLYFPKHFVAIVSSPILISTGILLLSLLRLGSTQKIENEFDSTKTEETNSKPRIEKDSGPEFDPKPFPSEPFVEWNVRAPLEVIYEEYEGEEDEQNDAVPKQIERHPSLSLYYPETDSDSSSGDEFSATGGWDSPESICFKWEEEDREGLIEIELNGKLTSELFKVEEDNLIEIDISPARMGGFSGDG